MIDEIKLRRLINHHLLVPTEKRTAAHDLIGIHAQIHSHAMHAFKIRCGDKLEGAVGEGLVKSWTLRGTMHIFAESDLPLFVRPGENFRRNEWNEASYWNQRKDWALSPQRQQHLSGVVLDGLTEGPLSRDRLKTLCREKGMTEAEEASMFHPWGGGIRELCERGFLHYAVQEDKVFCLAPEFTPLSDPDAELELARRYFLNYGPATLHDALYFFRTSASRVKHWLSILPVQSVQCDGRDFYYIDSGRDYNANIPACLFLAGFDQLMLGYEKKESLILDTSHLRDIFNLTGIVMPSILLHGNVVGRWKKKDNKLTIELFVPLQQQDKVLVKTTAEALWPNISKMEWK